MFEALAGFELVLSAVSLQLKVGRFFLSEARWCSLSGYLILYSSAFGLIVHLALQVL